VTDPRTTRRELVRRGAATTAAVTLAAAVPSLLEPVSALAKPVDDATVLASLLRVEQVMVFAYERALEVGVGVGVGVEVGVLSASAQPVLSSFAGQERAHVRALSASLRSLAGTVPAPPTTVAAFESELRHLRVRRSPATLRTERQHLRFLIGLETLIARHYRYAIARLSAEKQLLIAAEIMANEAQHATLLRELVTPGNFRRAVPSGFVAGMT
jgi:hypothetical protein